MMTDTGKYWDRALTLVEGCRPVSEACRNCWAAQQAHMRARQRNAKIRARYEGLTNGARCFNGTIRLMRQALELPLRVKKPTRWAIWNDLFHEQVPIEFIYKAFTMFWLCPQHTFLLLTKRIDRACAPEDEWPRNVWLGTTVEKHEYLGRIRQLQQVPAVKRFVSFEPLLGRVGLFPRAGIHWVVLGAETGRGAQSMELDWARYIIRQCDDAAMPYWVKAIDNRRTPYKQWPKDLQVREVPKW